MRKNNFFRMFAAATLTAGFLTLAFPVFAEEETKGQGIKPVEEEAGGAGLTLGLELGFGNVIDAVELNLTPSVVYEHSFGNIDVSAEVDYTFTFSDPTAQELYGEEEIGYNLGLGAGALSFILNNNNTIYIDPPPEDGATHEGVLEPSVKYTHPLTLGDVFFQPGLPVTYLTGVKDDDPAIGLYFKLGWASASGFGLEYTCDLGLSPDSDYTGSELLLSYENGPVYSEVEFVTDKEFKNFSVNPKVDCTLGAITFTLRAEIELPEEGDAGVSPFIGVGYSF